MSDLYRACPRCGETDVRSLGENVCGYCGCLFKISSRVRSTAASRLSILEAELKRIYADKQAWANVCMSEENDRLIGRITTLEAENKRLREALIRIRDGECESCGGGVTPRDCNRRDCVWAPVQAEQEAAAALQPNTAEDGAR